MSHEFYRHEMKSGNALDMTLLLLKPDIIESLKLRNKEYLFVLWSLLEIFHEFIGSRQRRLMRRKARHKKNN